MNKLFTKIAALFLGMTMAVGVGVAVGTSGQATKRVDAASYEIVFNNTDGSDGSQAINTLTDIVKTGGSYFSSVTTANRVYKGKKGYGVKLGGSGSKPGTLELTWDSTNYPVKPTSVVATIAGYGDSNGAKWGVNGSTNQSVAGSATTLTEYTLTMDGNTSLSSIKFTAAKINNSSRFYVQKVVVNYSESTVVYPDTLTITSSESIQESSGNYVINYAYNSSGSASNKTMTAAATKSGGGTVTDDSVTWTVTNNDTAGISGGTSSDKEVTFYVNTAVPGSNIITCTANGTQTAGTLVKTVTINVSDPVASFEVSLKTGKTFHVNDQITVDDIDVTSKKVSGADGGLTASDLTWSPLLPHTFEDTDEVEFTASYSGCANDSFSVTALPAVKRFTISNEIANATINGGQKVEDIVEGTSPNLTLAPNAKFLAPESITILDSKDNEVSCTYKPDDGTIVVTVNDDLRITGTASPASITSIEKTAGTTAFHLGDTFSTSDVKITATYNDTFNGRTASTEDVASGCVFDSSNVDTTTLSTGSGYRVDVTHTASSKTCYYYVTVTAAPVVAGGYYKVTDTADIESGRYLIVYETESVAFDGSLETLDAVGNTVAVEIDDGFIAESVSLASSEFTLDVENNTIQSASGYYIGRTTNSNGLEASLTEAYEHYNFEINSDGNFEAAGYVSGTQAYPLLQYNKASNQARFRYYKDGGSQEDIQLYKYVEGVEKEPVKVTATLIEKTRYAGGTLSQADFAVKLYYNDGNYDESPLAISTYTVTASALVAGTSNQATIRHTSTGFECVVRNIPAEEAKEMTSITWEQAGYCDFVGDNFSLTNPSLTQTITINYKGGTSETTNVANAAIGLYSAQNESSKVKDINTSYTWLSSDSYYLGVSITQGTVTKYAFSTTKMTMVDKIAEVRKQQQADFYQLVNDESELTIGDSIVIVSATQDVALSTTQGNNNRGTTSITKTDDRISWTGNNVQIITLEAGTVDDTFAFNVGNGYLYAASSSNNYLRTQTENNANGSFAIEITDGIANVVAQGNYTHNILQHNSANNLFSCYDKAQVAINIYKFVSGYEPIGENIANTDAAQQKAVLDFIADYTATVNAICLQSAGGTTDTAALKDAWNGTSGLAGRFATAAEAGQNFKDLFKYGYSDSDSEDPLRKMLGSYNWIYAKYGDSLGLTDFLNVTADRPEAPTQYLPTTSIFGNIENGNMVAIVVIVSVVSLTAIGGYFFLKKRREQN